jgi:cytochrome c biogenesis protein CcdA
MHLKGAKEMSKLMSKILYNLSDMFVPLIWGSAIGLLFGAVITTAADQRSIKQDCQVMGAFRLGDQVYDCRPRSK